MKQTNNKSTNKINNRRLTSEINIIIDNMLQKEGVDSYTIWSEFKDLLSLKYTTEIEAKAKHIIKNSNDSALKEMGKDILDELFKNEMTNIIKGFKRDNRDKKELTIILNELTKDIGKYSTDIKEALKKDIREIISYTKHSIDINTRTINFYDTKINKIDKDSDVIRKQETKDWRYLIVDNHGLIHIIEVERRILTKKVSNSEHIITILELLKGEIK